MTSVVQLPFLLFWLVLLSIVLILAHDGQFTSNVAFYLAELQAGCPHAFQVYGLTQPIATGHQAALLGLSLL